jgi:hypothetical protein
MTMLKKLPVFLKTAEQCLQIIFFFRFKGEIICPLCSNVDAENKQKAQGKAVEETRTAQPKTQNSAQKENKQRKTVAGTSIENMTDLTARSTSCSGAEEELRELILLKLTAVAEEMQDETDSRRVFESLEIIEKGLDLIERLY